MRLAQGRNAMTPVRLEAAATRSRVKHSTTEPLRSDDEVLVNRFFKVWLGELTANFVLAEVFVPAANFVLVEIFVPAEIFVL